MPIFRINSIDDCRIADYLDIPTRNLQRTDGRFIVEGRTLVERLVASQLETASILTSPGHVDQISPRVPPGVPIYVADGSTISQIVGFRFHRGTLACGIRPARLDLQDVLGELPEAATVVICPQTLDPANLGSILRNCHAFGVTTVVLGAQGADPFSRRAVRVSMGAALSLPIVESADLLEEMRRLQDQWRFEVVAAVVDSQAEELTAAARAPRLALVFGTEADEAQPDWLAGCTRRVTLPMHGDADSLNVASASAVFLYHFTRTAAVRR